MKINFGLSQNVHFYFLIYSFEMAFLNVNQIFIQDIILNQRNKDIQTNVDDFGVFANVLKETFFPSSNHNSS